MHQYAGYQKPLEENMTTTSREDAQSDEIGKSRRRGRGAGQVQHCGLPDHPALHIIVGKEGHASFKGLRLI
jgi:hypothetical protein